MSAGPQFSFVIPVYNEEDVLPELRRRLLPVIEQLGGEVEVLLINDGSRDGSWALMCEIHAEDPRFKAIDLSRNFGHQIAVTAGLDLALGRAVIILDADLQDPPEVILQLVERWREGYDIVYGIREDRNDDSWFKRTTARWFYGLLGRVAQVDVPMNVGDFRLVDRKAVEAVKSLRENSRSLRGMFSWVGFRQTGVPYTRPARYAGETKYPLRKMVKFASDGIVSFSNVPLRIALNLGFVASLLAFVGGFAAVAGRLFGAYTVPGWASLVVVVLFMGGMQLMVLGVMGEYVSRIYEEVRRRPLYIVQEAHGVDLQSRVERALTSTAESLSRASLAGAAEE